MKKFFTFIVIVAAVAMVSCCGNTQKSAEVVETEVVATECCDKCDSVATECTGTCEGCQGCDSLEVETPAAE